MNEEKRKSDAETRLVHYLAQHQMRRTPERMAILDKVMELNGRFVVDDLYKSLLTGGYYVSRATVYNCVNLLEASGIIRKLPVSDGAEQFECVDGRSRQHIHLVCSRCGKEREVKDAELMRMLSLRRFPSFVMSGFDLYVSGVCTRCRGGGRSRTKK